VVVTSHEIRPFVTYGLANRHASLSIVEKRRPIDPRKACTGLSTANPRPFADSQHLRVAPPIFCLFRGRWRRLNLLIVGQTCFFVYLSHVRQVPCDSGSVHWRRAVLWMNDDRYFLFHDGPKPSTDRSNHCPAALTGPLSIGWVPPSPMS